MKIKAEDLKKGDEIIISNYSNLRYLRVLTNARLNAKTGLCKSVYCSYRTEQMSNPLYSWTVEVLTPHEHNNKRNFNLNNRDIWLVKRENDNI